MAAPVDNDPEIGSLNAHLPGEPARAIVVTPGQENIDLKNNILSVLPQYFGRPTESPYEFLNDFYKICGIQKRQAGSTEEDYRLRVIPFALRAEADTWLMRLPPNSIRTGADFRSQFLDYFFPSRKTTSYHQPPAVSYQQPPATSYPPQSEGQPPQPGWSEQLEQ